MLCCILDYSVVFVDWNLISLIGVFGMFVMLFMMVVILIVLLCNGEKVVDCFWEGVWGLEWMIFLLVLVYIFIVLLVICLGDLVYDDIIY